MEQDRLQIKNVVFWKSQPPNPFPKQLPMEYTVVTFQDFTKIFCQKIYRPLACYYDHFKKSLSLTMYNSSKVIFGNSIWDKNNS